MKDNKSRIFIIAFALLLLAANAFTFSKAIKAELSPPASEGTSTKPAAPVSVPQFSDDISDSDTVVTVTSDTTVSDTAVPIPEVIVTSLDGTETAEQIDRIAKKHWCHGLSVAVIKDGSVSCNYEYGYADKKQTREVDSETKFRIASLSKVYTSMLGMKLAEDGNIDLDADIGEVFGFRVRNPYFTSTPITLRMLLSHTSSIRDKSPSIFAGDIRIDIDDWETYMQRKPGTGYNYTNLGMGIAGACIEKASGLVLTDYSNQVFLDRMEIDAAYNGAMLKEKDNIADCLLGSELKRSAKKLLESHGDKAPGENHTVGAGGLIVSAVDYARIISVLINNGTYRGEQLLSPETVAVIHEPVIEYEGFEQCIGVKRSESVIDGRMVYYHTGSAYGVFSFVVYSPEDRSGVVVFTTGAADRTNDMGIRKICLEISQEVYRSVLSDQPTE